MKNFFRFFVSAFPFTVGLILCLISLSYLVQFTDQSYYSNNALHMFIYTAAFGIPTILFGMRKLSSDSVL